LTSGPVADRVVEGTVVVVVGGAVGGVVEGTVVAVVEGTVVGVVDVGGELVPLVPRPGDEPAVVVVAGEPVVAEAWGSPPRARRADFVWNVSTPARPAAVAASTIGVRLIQSSLDSCENGSRSSKGELFVVDPVARHSELPGRRQDPGAEALRATHVDVAPSDVGHQLSGGAGVERDLTA